ncbi:MAG TPA: 3-oxoacyl-[acyl-carrier-protein] reductase [Bacteroidales bacterium]|nr:3-oxoacyl-[acyl-carrier-protein] reductase [Bacteroidales bacterium]HOH21969.1 3-oxoacyl-[acyl-carrier-protein] reductase [Bacteroidales bacterium]HPZ03500.1 3-oxoacyl-[acyl-carrier-protein] reductase [Bacteroidales bacterium]HQB74890.1 3-oxoacyl-[acyl-carrier-protein] reductase [Bacteroidales bacterium]
MSKLLLGKTAMITGGGRGIGKQIVLTFAEQGANVIITDLKENEAILQLVKDVEGMGVEALFLAYDVSKLDQTEEAIKKAVERFGRIDILVNNAGITRDTLLMRMKEEDWDMVMNVNVKSIFNHTKAIQSVMLKQRFGSIINMGSVVGITGNAGQVNYSASKAAVIGLSKSVARELGSRNIRCNVIAPGFIETEMTQVLSQEVREAYLKTISLRRPGTPQDIANTALYLASDLSSYITGQVIVCDGGM